MRQRIKALAPDLVIIAFLLMIPLLLFVQQTLGGRTLLPLDNLFQYEPYQSLADDYGVETPHNDQLSDLVLQNLAWKQFALDQIEAKQIPLWQPNIAGGAPFLAAGQSSILYPFSIIFLILPLSAAYGWFTISQLWVAAINMYILARILGIRRPGALTAALAYQLSGFMLSSVVFPMIIAAAAWLPLTLAMVELTIRQEPAFNGQPATIPWVALGAFSLGMTALAGHVEILYFTLLVSGYFAAFRLIAGTLATWSEPGRWGRLFRRSGWLIALVVLGLALGAIQTLPSYELASRSFREGAASLEQVRHWAYPPRRLLAFFMPNFFGNPAHHQIFDLFTWTSVPVTTNAAGEAAGGLITNTHWGVKNYVEGGAYMGILTMALAGIAALHWLVARVYTPKSSYASTAVDERFLAAESAGRPYRLIFSLLGILSTSFVFGTPTYALLYYGLPFINQSHSPFRWVWPLTLAVAVLSGFGVNLLQSFAARMSDRELRWEGPTFAMKLGVIGSWSVIGVSGVMLLTLIVTRFAYGAVEGIIQRTFEELALAPTAFVDGRMFYSYQAGNVLIFAIMLALSGAVFILNRDVVHLPLPDALKSKLPIKGDIPVWLAITPLIIIVDLFIAVWGFYPAADPALLEVIPDSITWLKEQQAESVEPFRFIAYEQPGADTFNSNIGWLHGLQEASGYDSLIPAQYADTMRLIQPQDDLQYNRIAPLYAYHGDGLDSGMLDLLNVRYVISESAIDNPKYEQVYIDEAVQIYENRDVMPRAFTLPSDSTVIYFSPEDLAEKVKTYNVKLHVLMYFEPDPLADPPRFPGTPALYSLAAITVYTPNEVWIDASVDEESWLILSDSYFPGWKAYVRPFSGDDASEEETEIYLVDGNFRGVLLEEGNWTVRFKYSPDSVKLGGFISFMAGMLIIFSGGVWVWRFAYKESEDDSSANRIAKNSITPIILNLFNRGIQFAFAFIMLRILGPEGSGKYQYAVVIWGWFEIVSNFGLDTFLLREVSRNREDANRYLASTTFLRLILAVIGIPLLWGFIQIRQSIGTDPLAADTLTAIWVLYGGLFLSTLNKGFTGLFYAFEKAEYPAAVQTVGTMLTASLGVVALIMGFGIVGLAGVSVIVNVVTLILITTLTVRLFFTPRPTFDWKLQRGAMSESFPLMINHLLATLFFRIDIILLEVLTNARVVGWYGVVYKWIDALNVIPSFFTQALFPVMARQAAEDKPALRRSYILSVKLLALIALPVAVITTLLATFLIGLLGGKEFLPHGAIALQIFVWSIPIGWINSVTNYVIIALDRQRILTWAFVVGVIFNVGANLYFIPIYSYPAAAVITILSELILLIFFYLVMRPALGDIPWVKSLWKVVAATIIMGGVTFAIDLFSTPLALVGGGLTYLAAIAILKPFTPDELESLAPVIPGPLRSRLMPTQPESSL